jgi:thiol-disulfide isomerase/thioredoxin
VVVIAAVIAVAASRGGGNNTAAAGTEQTRPVQVTGDPLPTLTSGPDPAVGSIIPELHGASFDGTPVDVTRAGQAKLILFVAHWCPHCQREVPLLADFLRSHPLPAGVQLVTVATATSADLPNYPPSTWLASQHWPAPILADSSNSDAAKAFGLPGYPYFVAVDSTGHVVARTSGEITPDQFVNLAQRALGID